MTTQFNLVKDIVVNVNSAPLAGLISISGPEPEMTIKEIKLIGSTTVNKIATILDSGKFTLMVAYNTSQHGALDAAVSSGAYIPFAITSANNSTTGLTASFNAIVAKRSFDGGTAEENQVMTYECVIDGAIS